MCTCVGTRMGRYRLIWTVNLPPCSVSVSTKCLCHSIWLAALQTTCVSTGMKHTIIPPRWLGWFFFIYLWDLFPFLMWETFFCHCSGLHLSDWGVHSSGTNQRDHRAVTNPETTKDPGPCSPSKVVFKLIHHWCYTLPYTATLNRRENARQREINR